jgi:hypothetical protein
LHVRIKGLIIRAPDEACKPVPASNGLGFCSRSDEREAAVLAGYDLAALRKAGGDGGPNNETHVFHTFRHTYTTLLTQEKHAAQAAVVSLVFSSGASGGLFAGKESGCYIATQGKKSTKRARNALAAPTENAIRRECL